VTVLRRWSGALRFVLIAAAAVFACWLPFQLSLSQLGLYDRMGLYTLVAIGLTLLMGFAGQVSLGQGAFFLIGAYTSALLTVGLDPDDRLLDPSAGIDPLWAVAAAPVVTGVVAAVIGVPLLRLRGHYLAFATLAFHLIMVSLLFAQDRFFGGQYGVTVAKPLEVGGHTLNGARHAAVVWALVAVALVLSANLVHSRAGRALQTIAVSEAAAAGTGIAVATYKLRLFVFAAALAGLAGGLFVFFTQFVGPEDFGIVLSLQFVLMVAVGGLGNVYGAVVGTVAILYLEHEVRELGTRASLLGWDLPPQAPSVLSLGAFGLILITVMLFFPRGLLPAVLDGLRAARTRGARGG
jgi:branched-chain amino acid transport system permease protein